MKSLAPNLVVCTTVLLSACGSTPVKLDDNTFPLPKTFQNAAAPADGAANATANATAPAQWWTQYGSDELNRLVDRALASNSELKVATLQVAQAKIRADQSRAGKWPSLSAPIRAATQNQGATTDSTQNSQVALASTFRLDVWGEQRALSDSADMQLERAIHERENIQRNTIGAVVSTYIAYLSVSDSILIAQENERVAQDILHNVERRMALGDATADDLEQQRSVVFGQQVVIPGLENQQDDLRNNLSRLVGALPGNLVLTSKGLDALQMPSVQSGLPSALLLARPDIRMMEARMRGANADIEVAHARLLPPIDLSAQAGYNGASWATLFQPQNFLVNTVAALTVSIFDGGAKRADKAYAQSYYEEMVETYGRTVLQAVREVESALASLRTSRARLEAQRNATRSALNLFKIGSEAYAAGSIDQSALLESRKNYQRSADESQRIKAELLRNYANLSYALGLGAILTEPGSADVADTAHTANAGADLRVGLVAGVARLVPQAPAGPTAHGQWEVELPGVFHRSSLLPLWRDMHARFDAAASGPSMRAVHLDHTEGPGQSGQAWYRVYVTDFADRATTASYCDTLLQAGQGCKVVADTRGGQKSAFWMPKNESSSH